MIDPNAMYTADDMRAAHRAGFVDGIATLLVALLSVGLLGLWGRLMWASVREIIGG